MARHKITAFILISTLSLIVYANSLNNSFHFDDEHYIVNNFYIRYISNIPSFFISPRYLSSEKPFTAHYRPLVVSSYALNYAIGGLNPFGYHLVNLGFHVGTALMVFMIVEAILKSKFQVPPGRHCEESEGRRSNLSTPTSPCNNRIIFFTPLASALIFVAHPFNSEGVNYITARSSVMCAFFYLLAFYCWVKYREIEYRGAYLFSLLTFLLAMLSKEIAITLPAVLFLYDLFFIPVERKVAYLKRLLSYLPFIFFTVIPYLVLRKLFYGHFISSKLTRHISVNLYTQAKVVFEYIMLLLFPSGLTIDHPVRTARSFFEIEVIFSTVILSGFLWLACLLWRYKDFWRILSFFILWFFVTLLPVSVIPLNAIMQENRAYLAGVGFAVIVGVGIGRLSHYPSRIPLKEGEGAIWKRNFICLGILIPLIIAYSTATVYRNKVWKDDITLWSDAVKKAPLSPRSLDNLGLAYSRAGNREKAEEMYKRTLQVAPDYLFPYFNLGVLYSEQEEWDKAEFYYREAIRLYPSYVNAYYNLGLLYRKTGNYDRAIEVYEKAISIDPRAPSVYNNLGVVYSLKGENERAIQAFLEAIQRDPGYATAHYNLANIYETMGDYKRAVQAYEAVLRIEPTHEKAKEKLKRLREGQ